MVEAGTYAVVYEPQNSDCRPLLLGDFNNDSCVDRNDLSVLLNAIRSRSTDPSYDLNADGQVNIADARYLALHFTNPDGSGCPP
jgi:hypothetical protein